MIFRSNGVSLSIKKNSSLTKFGWLKTLNENQGPNPKYTYLLYEEDPQTLIYEAYPLTGLNPCLKYPQGMHMAALGRPRGRLKEGLGFP